jgi:hypothetical protein
MPFYPAHRWGGGAVEAHPYWVSSGQNLIRGQFVTFHTSVGCVPSSAADWNDPVLGVTAEDHDATTVLGGRQIGTELLVYDDPSIIFRTTPKTALTSTGGSTVTIEIANLNNPSTDAYTDGYLVMASSGAAPSGYVAGTVLKITASTTSGKLTFTGLTTGTFAATSDATWYVYPGKRAVTYAAWDLRSSASELDLSSTGAYGLTLVKSVFDPLTKEGNMYFRIRLHQYGNLPSAS